MYPSGPCQRDMGLVLRRRVAGNMYRVDVIRDKVCFLEDLLICTKEIDVVLILRAVRVR